MMTPHIEKLIVKWFNKSANIFELNELSDWIEIPKNKDLFKDYVLTHYAINFNLSDCDSSKIKILLLERIRGNKPSARNYKMRIRLKYAAVVLLFLGVGYIFNEGYFTNSPESNSPNIVNQETNSIEVGSDKAILTLEDGTTVALEKDKIYQSDRINSNGKELVYNKKNSSKTKIVYNYLTIPRGGQFFVKLSDGTKVWLNSESQLKYPVSFSKGSTREVELVYGEAYFDVSPSSNHNGAKFRVLNKNQEIEVLGTEFNIKAYDDEDVVYTTLVAGIVEVNNTVSKKILAPSQQSKISLGSNNIYVNEVDVYNEISWKDGVFSFEEKPLKEIMKVLSRWYDIEVVFQNTSIENEEFIGVLGKEQEIEHILTNIQNFGIINEFKITDKKVVLE